MDDEEYAEVNGGSLCPTCHGSNIESSESMQVDGSTAWQKMYCADCRAEWNDIYSLSSYSPTVHSDKSQLQIEVLKAARSKSS